VLVDWCIVHGVARSIFATVADQSMVRMFLSDVGFCMYWIVAGYAYLCVSG
jgi:hypothetical protein